MTRGRAAGRLAAREAASRAHAKTTHTGAGASIRAPAGVSRPVAALVACPNPARDAFRLRFTHPAPGVLRVEVYDVLRRRVQALDGGGFAPGLHAVRLSAGEHDSRRGVSAGPAGASADARGAFACSGLLRPQNSGF